MGELLFRPMGELMSRKMTPGDRYTWGFLGGTPGENCTVTLAIVSVRRKYADVNQVPGRV